MSILDYFTSWKKTTATVKVLTQVPDANGNWVETWTTGASYTGIKYSRSDAQRYYSQTWAADVQDVLVIGDPGSLSRDDKLSINSVLYAVDSIVDVAEQGEVWLIGLRLHV